MTWRPFLVLFFVLLAPITGFSLCRERTEPVIESGLELPSLKSFLVQHFLQQTAPKIQNSLLQDFDTLGIEGQKEALTQKIQEALQPLDKPAKSWPQPLGGHNDFDPVLYAKFFGKVITYQQWQNLPSGTRAEEDRREGLDAFVVTLTSWPARTNRHTPGIWSTIESLMQQTEKPDRILLWLSREEYPNQHADLPVTLLDLEKRGLEIFFLDGNTKAAKKLIPALQSGIRANILTADDDWIYKPAHLQEFIKDAKENSGCIIAHETDVPTIQDGKINPLYQWCHYSFFPGEHFQVHHKECGRHYFSNTLGHLNGLGCLYPYDPSGQTLNGLDRRILSYQLPKTGMINDDMLFAVFRILAGTEFVLTASEAQPKELFLPESLYATQNGYGENNKALLQFLIDFPELVQKLDLDPQKQQAGLAPVLPLVPLTLRDLSLDPPVLRTQDARVWLMTYADDRTDSHIFQKNANFLMESALNPGIHGWIQYGPEDLPQDFKERHAFVLKNFRWAGLGIWKPLIILDALERAKENDIVLYMDSGFSVQHDVSFLHTALKNNDLFLLQSSEKRALRPYMPKDVIHYLGLDEASLDFTIPWSGIVGLRNCDKSRNFVKRWLKYCEDPKVFLCHDPKEEQDPSFTSVPYGDADILGLCLFEETAKTKNASGLSVHYEKIGQTFDQPQTDFYRWHHRHPNASRNSLKM